MIRIGYACLTLGVPATDFKSCIMKNASDERLMEIISHNLISLENIVDYNIRNNIKLFRISSDIIPFGSSPVNKLDWWNIFEGDFYRIRRKIEDFDMRISMHPGQYTVLNSPDENIVSRAVADLIYHNKFLESLGANSKNKIVLHLGGVYGERQKAMNRFSENYKMLPDSIKEKLVLENDDRSYSVCDILKTAVPLKIPVIYDNLHNKVNNCGSESDFEWIKECNKTWGFNDGRQKIHYSQQNKEKQSGAHTLTIAIDEFMQFYKSMEEMDLDIMLEVKDKNISAVKCQICTSEKKHPGALQADWARYKYFIMERSPQAYNQARSLFNREDYPAIEFYNLAEKCMNLKTKQGEAVNAAEHVWGYFKKVATEKEKVTFFRNLEKYKEGKLKLSSLKKGLYNMVKKYDSSYLKESYYFVDI